MIKETVTRGFLYTSLIAAAQKSFPFSSLVVQKISDDMRQLVLAVLCLMIASCVKATTQYNATVAMKAWLYTKPSSCKVKDIEAWDCAACSAFPQVTSVHVVANETAETQGYAAYDPTLNWIVFAFRGSRTLLNWIDDFDGTLVPYPSEQHKRPCVGPNASSPCRVHQGFHRVYMSMESQLFAAAHSLLQRYGPARPTVMITGHSLGATTALLFALDFVAAFPTQTMLTVYTFGEPRVGDPAFAAWAVRDVLPEGRQFRITHKADPVPRLPPLEFGYLHAMHEVWYDNDLAGDHFTYCNDTAVTEDLSCSMSQFALEFKDHSLYMGIHSGCSAP